MKDKEMPKAEQGKDGLGQAPQTTKETYATVVLTKDSLDINHPQKITHTVGQSKIIMEPGKITIDSPKVTSTVTQRFETVGPTFLGLDARDELAPKVETEAGPAKKTYAKAE
jgi:hypothetical protein